MPKVFGLKLTSCMGLLSRFTHTHTHTHTTLLLTHREPPFAVNESLSSLSSLIPTIPLRRTRTHWLTTGAARVRLSVGPLFDVAPGTAQHYHSDLPPEGWDSEQQHEDADSLLQRSGETVAEGPHRVPSNTRAREMTVRASMQSSLNATLRLGRTVDGGFGQALWILGRGTLHAGPGKRHCTLLEVW